MSLKDVLFPFTAWKNLFKEPITVKKPLTERPGAPRYRGFHKNDISACIGCGTCETICQNAAIDMVPVEGVETKHGDSGLRPSIDYGRCCWCALCVDICATNSLTMSNEYVWIDNDPEVFRFVPGAENKPWDNSELGYQKPANYELYPLKKVTMAHDGADKRRETFLEYMMGYTPEEALREADRCIECGLCTATCPGHMEIPQYIKAVREDDMELGLQLLYNTNPVPETCGRICPETCANSCALGHRGDAIAISWLKRYIADRIAFDDYTRILAADGVPVTGKKVAIVGAGPAGLSLAYYLRREGIASTIYEAMPAGGGMMRYGIPEYRMPKALLDQEVGFVEKLDGVTVKYNTKVGKDITLEQLKKDFDAVAVTVGSWKATGLGVKGDELALGGIVFLEEIARAGWTGENPGVTVVIGGGNTAMDCVRTSIRLGSTDVTCAYRRTRKEMPAQDIEVTEALEEGVNFKFLSAPVSLEQQEDGKIKLTLIDMELGEPDKSGRRRPQPVEGSESTMLVDTVIAAIGQGTVAPEGVSTNKWGDLPYDKETNLVEDNVFTAGDCATGPATVIEAVGHAKRTATSIATFLRK